MSAPLHTLLGKIAQRLPPPGQDEEGAVRLFHGRGRCYEGLEWINIDWYPPLVLITLYDAAGEPLLGALGDGLRQGLGGRLAMWIDHHDRR